MAVLNKTIVPSSLASMLLHGALVAGFSFNAGTESGQYEQEVRFNIQLNPSKMVSEVNEPVGLPEENQDKVADKSPLEPLSQPVVSTPKPSENKVITTEIEPDPVKSEAVSEAQLEPPSDESFQPKEISTTETAILEEQVSTSASDSMGKVDPVQLWFSELQQRINQHRRYPRQAIKRGLEGDVRISAVISVDGSLVSAEVLSGHRSFHSNSLRSLKQALPFPPPAGTRQPVTVVFTIHYKLEAVLFN